MKPQRSKIKQRGFNPVGVLATNDVMFRASRKAVFLTLASGERPSICNNMDMIQIMLSFLDIGWLVVEGSQVCYYYW